MVSCSISSVAGPPGLQLWPCSPAAHEVWMRTEAPVTSGLPVTRILHIPLLLLGPNPIQSDLESLAKNLFWVFCLLQMEKLRHKAE